MKIFAALIFRRVPQALFRILCQTSNLTRQMRLSYLPPLMVYLAAGVSGLTGIVGTFFVKDYLDLPAEFLAMLGFWVGLPWALKMPLGHLIDPINEQVLVAADYSSLGTLLIIVTALGLLLPLCCIILVKKGPELAPLRVSELIQNRMAH